ncbi:SigE family RNA polymerase sigma factor [Solwaraspora sp. WMMD1047]|jgi:RNA polymerase sigma-70 factor (sigma-E family)|uniref:SigE family RNA polymerase sigma factor n=1 Tax=Solwaraspora sp. WMMD1047 TaxID=3016102 RepID=UPI002417E149|nr:SigE family RNA polymerase sigma factor [Solwaraspora sp. WMMD1047]MDG4828702.1 SigE family RNA polymerase sigma factor [Solwaraspora sp. WMMD1047]
MRHGSEPEHGDPDGGYVEYVTARLPRLRRLAYSLCGDADQADDLVQEAITKLYLHWSRVPRIAHLDAYVRAIVVRTFLDAQRKGWWRVLLPGTLPDVPQPLDPSADDRDLLRAALAKLPPRQRAVLVLRFLHDLPVNECAEILGCTAGTVKSQTSHGLTALRKILGDREFADIGGQR